MHGAAAVRLRLQRASIVGRQELAGLAFGGRCENVILLGYPGGESPRPLPRCESVILGHRGVVHAAELG
ncbi:hypothetical protein KCP78_25790 [Salmonella enterica subsp. enterica]|nr:hypothetical protein KCP78_25790 [Salmonella enterica subsp. enterica]